jgi:SAM-dependent methyltransferase/uncharacterized protein YbaR (Trm112 family)
MREKLLDYLACPLDGGEIELVRVHERNGPHIMSGSLRCRACAMQFPVTEGVPHFLPDINFEVDGENLAALQKATIDRFGFEWRYFKDWGWLEGFPDVPEAEERFYGGILEHTKRAFASKSLLDPGELRAGVSVLDAGCGNGRFSYMAGLTGADVVGIDLGWGVFSAFEHTRHMDNIHIVRGDLFRLPLKRALFDRVFSIGVLMHTGNAERAFASISAELKPGGLITAHVYGRGRRSYEVLDAMIRGITTRLPKSAQMWFAGQCAALARWLRRDRRRGWYHRLYSHINLLPTDHHMFDWWSAPIATHHTLPEVMEWFSEQGIEVIETRPSVGSEKDESARRRQHGAVTVKGRKH